MGLIGDDFTWESCPHRTLYVLNRHLLIIEIIFTSVKVHGLLFYLLPKSFSRIKFSYFKVKTV